MQHGEHSPAQKPLTIFYCSAPADNRLRAHLDRHLSPLRDQGLITALHQIPPGTDKHSATPLMSANIILLLITPHFMSDKTCSLQLQQALQRADAGNSLVVPLLLRHVDLSNAPFAHLQALPRDGSPVATWKDRDEAFTTIAKELRYLIENFQFKPITLPPIAQIPSSSHTTASTPGGATVSLDPDRQRMFNLVEKYWINGLLEHSLQQEIQIELGLHQQPDALANPWQFIVQETNLPPRQLPAGTTIQTVYDQTNGSLLILGEPGAGKTTMLLDLTRHLLTCARAAEDHPIPVIFHLSTWSSHQAPLADWLISELHDKYEVPRQLAQTWVAQDQLLLLLDGLDEVTTTARPLCIQAINRYHQEHRGVPLIICSRSSDYMQQKERLHLDQAVTIQPLTDAQIERTLLDIGPSVAGLHEVIQHDQELRTLAHTPLMFSVMLMTYQQLSAAEISASAPTNWSEHLFTNYIQNMFKRRSKDKRYKPEQTVNWLSSLAKHMKAHNQSIFTLESLQPEILSPSQQKIYNLLAVRLPAILMGMMVFLAVSIIFFIGFRPYIPFILTGGVVGWLVSLPMKASRYTVSNQRKNQWKRYLSQTLRTGVYMLFMGLIGAIIGITIFRPLPGEQNLVPVFSLPFILGLSIFSALFESLSPNSGFHPLIHKNGSRISRLVYTFHRIWDNIHVRRTLLVGGGLGLIVGISYGLIYGLRFGQNSGIPDALSHWLRYGLNYGLSGLLLSFALKDNSRTINPADRLIWSWHLIKRSLFHRAHIRMVWKIAFVIGMISGLNDILFSPLTYDTLINALNVSLSIGLIFGLSYWLLLGLFQGIESLSLDKHQRLRPNQGIHRSFWNALLLGCLSCIVLWGIIPLSLAIGEGLSVVVIGFLRYLGGGWIYSMIDYTPSLVLNSLQKFTLSFVFNFALSDALVIAFCGGMLVWFLRGGLAWWRHWCIRCLLALSRNTPWHYVRFLDYAAELILLRKVGNGYIFIHRLLLERFVSLHTNIPSQPK